jgi:hypothetical protein
VALRSTQADECRSTPPCHRSGTWADDAKNFERAWGQAAPSGLRIPHSWFWRSAHFTREEAYYFQVERNAEWMRGFIAENRLQPVDDAASVTVSHYSCFFTPAVVRAKAPGRLQGLGDAAECVTRADSRRPYDTRVFRQRLPDLINRRRAEVSGGESPHFAER